MFLLASAQPIRQQTEEERLLSSYPEDSICYPRPCLASGVRGDLEGTLKEFLFYRFLTQRFLFEEKREKKSKAHGG